MVTEAQSKDGDFKDWQRTCDFTGLHDWHVLIAKQTFLFTLLQTK